jgi:biopolymer transport protein ExbD
MNITPMIDVLLVLNVMATVSGRFPTTPNSQLKVPGSWQLGVGH